MIKRINITLNTDNLTDLMLIKSIGIPLENLGSKEIKRYLLNTIVDDDFLFNQKRNVLSALQSNMNSNLHSNTQIDTQSIVKSNMNSESKSVVKKVAEIATDKQVENIADDEFDFDDFITEEEVIEKEDKKIGYTQSLMASMNSFMK